jgi:hypothetical protein
MEHTTIRNNEFVATNETVTTCKYCGLPIQIDIGVYLEENWKKGHMGWFHYPMCVWTQEAIWKTQEES